MVDYAAIYRKANPKRFFFSPYEKQRELSDLWPDLQEEFKRTVDATLKHKEQSDG
jgi:hypothetical protein